MYYGDEIGLTRVDVPPELAQDPWEKREPGLGVGRDPWRTPLQWDDTANAGFSSGRPWLPISPDFQARNITALRADDRSILSLYRVLVALRHAHDAFSLGDQRVLSANDDVLLFERSHAGETFVVALNFGTESRTLRGLGKATLMLSTHLDRSTGDDLVLRGAEGVILKLR
jgi:alpha-glucosidase